MQVTSTVKMEHQSDIKFSDHTPFIFWELREIFGVDHESYLKSVSEPTMEKFSEGASGAFMYCASARLLQQPCKRCHVAHHALPPPPPSSPSSESIALPCLFACSLAQFLVMGSIW